MISVQFIILTEYAGGSCLVSIIAGCVRGWGCGGGDVVGAGIVDYDKMKCHKINQIL
jgi:hypothetical protein